MELGHAIQDLGNTVYRFEPGPDGKSVVVAAVLSDGAVWLGHRRGESGLLTFPSREAAIAWLDAPRLVTT